MPRSIKELLAAAIADGHAPTTKIEARYQYAALMIRFKESYGLASYDEVAAAIWDNLIDDHAMVEDWISVRQGMNALGILSED